MMRYVASFVRTGNPNPAGGGLPRWEAWSNEPGDPKSVIFDVRGDDPDIRMTDRELTVSGVDEAMAREAPPELVEKATAYMARSRGVVRSD